MIQRQHFLRTPSLALCALLALLIGCSKSTGSTTAGSGTPTPTTTGTVVAGTPTPGTPGAATPTPVTSGPSDWVSVVFDSTIGRQNPLTIANLNPFSSNHINLTTIPVSNQGAVDSVSPDGQSLAFHVLNGSASTYSVTHIDGVTGPHSVGAVNNAVGAAIWEHDNAHLAVAGSGQVTILSTTGQAPTTLAGVYAAALVSFSPDNASLFYVTTGVASGQAHGALYRLPLSDTAHPVQISPAESSSRFLLSPDGQTAYFNNTASSGVQGIYSVSAQNGGTPTLVRQTAGVPVGFSSSGALLYAIAQAPVVTLLQVAPSGSADGTIVANLIAGSATVPDLGADVVVAPDGSSVITFAANGTGSYKLFYTSIRNGGNQTTFSINDVSRADLIGWDTVIISAGS